jgi:hypothetical protein
MNDEHVVVREPVEVMLVRVADALPEIQRAWAAFETAGGRVARAEVLRHRPRCVTIAFADLNESRG